MPKFIAALLGRREIAAATWEFTIGLRGQELAFRPGQTIDVTQPRPAYADAHGNTRTFSLAAAPRGDRVRIATRVRGSGFKTGLLEAPWGAELEITGPFGSFTLPRQPTAAVLLAGGIGITPFRAMVEDARARELAPSFLLVHSNRVPAEAPYLAELERWSREHARFRYVPTMTHAAPEQWAGERRRVGPELLGGLLPDDRNGPLYFVAGPEGFVRAAEGALATLGIDPDRVRVEEFAGYEEGEPVAGLAAAGE